MATEIMDQSRKRTLGIYSFIPVLAFLIATAYHLFAFRREVATKELEDHIALSTETARHWNSLMVLYGAASIISLAVLLYFIVHLLKLKQMSSGSKLGWAAFLTFLSPVSFPIFWYMQIRNEPRRLETYDDI